jgi:gamma-glutamylcyclotransferase (GGCT)/AIG2-like uncharacterized protein YtfP
MVFNGWIYNYLCNQCQSPLTGVVASNPVHGEVYSIQHYVIKFVSELRQVSGLKSNQFKISINLLYYKPYSLVLYCSNQESNTNIKD